MVNQRKFRSDDEIWYMQPDGRLTDKPSYRGSTVAYNSLAEFGEYHQFTEIEPQEAGADTAEYCARCLFPTPADMKLDGKPLCWPCCQKVIENGIGPRCVVAEPLQFTPAKAA